MSQRFRLAIIVAAIAVLTSSALFSLTGLQGSADRIGVRPNNPLWFGIIQLRESPSVVNDYYWGGTKCAGMPAPSDQQVRLLLEAHLANHEVSLDYNLNGTDRCWDGGIQIW